ncbi:MAG: hypothetical protein SGJ13_02530 [Actinomycetota bacterium]|nr:hypothetical protein [Actinomycetota bacterium]
MSERRHANQSPVQLRLLPGDREKQWRLDEITRTTGRRGVAEARDILRRARPPEPARRAS